MIPREMPYRLRAIELGIIYRQKRNICIPNKPPINNTDHNKVVRSSALDTYEALISNEEIKNIMNRE